MVKCYKCRKANLVEAPGVFEYEQANLPYRVMLVGVPMKQCPACGEVAVTIPDPEGLHRLLCLQIIQATRPLHHQEIRFLRKHLDKSAEDWADLMGVDAKTISRWENGHQKMGPQAERLMRLMVNEHMRPRVKSFTDEVFPRLRGKPGSPPPVLTLASSKGAWKKAA